MRNRNLFTRMMPTCLTLAVGLALCLATTTDAAAQRGGFRGPQQLAPEKAEAAWKVQAACALADLKLNDEEKASKVSEAYVAARKSRQEAVAELRPDSGGGRDMRQAFRELNQKERDSLAEALNAILSEEQTTQLMASLGTFSTMWDRNVDALTGLELEKEALNSSLALLLVNTIEAKKARDEAMKMRRFQDLGGKRQELRQKLDTDLAEVLSEEELAEWKVRTTSPGRGPGRGPGPGR